MNIIIKFLIASILAASSMENIPSDGWFTVEKVPQTPEQGEEGDPSIWVLFSKNLGAEKILVRFPDDPTVRYNGAGAWEFSSTKEGETFLLTVQEAGAVPVDTPIPEGKWLSEEVIQTPHYIYHLKTLSDRANGAHHSEFVSSFLIEKNN